MRSRDLPWSRTLHITAPAGVTWAAHDDHIAYQADHPTGSFFHRLLLDEPPDDLAPWKARWHALNGDRGVETPMFAWESRTHVPTPEGQENRLWCLMLDRAIEPREPSPDVRALTPDDLDTMLPFFLEDSGGRSAPEDWGRWMIGGLWKRMEGAPLGCGGVWLGRFDARELVGMAGLMWDRREARFHTVITKDGYRRQGIARELVERCVQRYQEASFGIVYIAATPDGPAERLYRGIGFRRTTAVTQVRVHGG